MKKTISILTFLTLLFGTVSMTVLAAEPIRVEAEFFEDGVFLDDYTNQMRMYANNWGTYLVEFHETGTYTISITAGVYENIPHAMELSLDGVLQGSGSFTPIGTDGDGRNYAEYTVATIVVGSVGTHEVKLKMTTGNIRLDYFTCTRISDIRFGINAKPYADGKVALNDGTNFVLSKAHGDFVEYNVDFPQIGTYELSLNIGASSAPWVKAYVDGTTFTVSNPLAATGNTYSIFEDRILGTFTIDSVGVHSIKVEMVLQEMSLKKLTFTRVGDISVTNSALTYTAGKVSSTDATYGLWLNKANSDWVEYDIDFPQTGTYELLLNIASANAPYVTAYVDDTTIIASSKVLATTGDYYVFQDRSMGKFTVTSAGVHKIKVVMGLQIMYLKKVIVTRTDDAAELLMASSWNGNKVDYSINNKTQDNKNVMLICSVYSNDGLVLRQVDVQNVTLLPGTNLLSTGTLTNYLKRDKVKIFLWNNNNLTPLVCGQYVMPVNL